MSASAGMRNTRRGDLYLDWLSALEQYKLAHDAYTRGKASIGAVAAASVDMLLALEAWEQERERSAAGYVEEER